MAPIRAAALSVPRPSRSLEGWSAQPALGESAPPGEQNIRYWARALGARANSRQDAVLTITDVLLSPFAMEGEGSRSPSE